jgi:hypothetical protein
MSDLPVRSSGSVWILGNLQLRSGCTGNHAMFISIMAGHGWYPHAVILRIYPPSIVHGFEHCWDRTINFQHTILTPIIQPRFRLKMQR